MSTHWQDWAHVMSSFRGQWLPGDARGFRSRRHVIHSSGNYKTPPPPHEHAGLREHASSILKKQVTLSLSQCELVKKAIVHKLQAMGLDCAALAVTGTHAHALIRVEDSDAVRVFARAKQYASNALRRELPGSIWGRGAHVVRMTSEQQLRQAIAYILAHGNQGASVWTWDPAPSPAGAASDAAST